jgi:hypothetical protein
VSDGHDARWLVDQLVPSITAMIDNLVVGFEDAVGEPIIPHELPDVFDGIEFWAFCWQRDDADVLGYDARGGHMPPGLIHEQYGMGTRCHGSSDFSKVQVHRVGIAERQDKPCALAQCGADRSEDVGRYGALIIRCRWARPTLRPPARDLVFLTYARLVLEPDFYRSALREACANFFQFGCKAPFLNASNASVSCAW